MHSARLRGYENQQPEGNRFILLMLFFQVMIVKMGLVLLVLSSKTSKTWNVSIFSFRFVYKNHKFMVSGVQHIEKYSENKGASLPTLTLHKTFGRTVGESDESMTGLFDLRGL